MAVKQTRKMEKPDPLNHFASQEVGNGLIISWVRTVFTKFVNQFATRIMDFKPFN